jgi:retron-type reverse transcriptase
MYEAFRRVKRNQGAAAGTDGQILGSFESDLEVGLSCLLLDLKEKR